MNLCKCGCGQEIRFDRSFVLGHHVRLNHPTKSKEVREKISLSLSGDKNPSKRPEVREKISLAKMGKGHSLETKKKISNWMRENNPMKRPEVAAKVSKKIASLGENHPMRRSENKRFGKDHPSYGKHHSVETKNKMSEAMKGRHYSEEHRRKISQAKKGNQNPNWNSGSSFLPYSLEWTRELRQFIKDRDNNECQNPYCDCKTKGLTVHHIDYNKQNCSQFNLITLCRSCNIRVNTDRKEWKRLLRKILWSKY